MWRFVLAALALMMTGATAVLGPAEPVQVPTETPALTVSVTAPAENRPRPAAAPRSPHQVPVLLYHHLQPGAGGENGAIVAAEEFEAQMAWLKTEGFTGITTAELGLWLAGKGTLPERPVLITFDDGYRSNYEHAFPVLRRHGLRATIFMVSGYAGKKLGDFEYLTGAQMQEMERSGLIELQAHTHDGHSRIDGVSALRFWTEAEIRRDLQTLRHTLAEAGLNRPAALAYPFGDYDAEAIRALWEEGIQLGFTVEHGYVRRGDPPMELKRLTVYPGTSVCRLGELVTGRSAGTCSD